MTLALNAAPKKWCATNEPGCGRGQVRGGQLREGSLF